MTPIEVGLAGFILIMITILMGVHVAFALILVGFCGLALIIGFEPALSSVALIAFNKVNSYDFAVVPLFLLMSAFVSRSGIGKEAYETACAWVGQLKGGLSMATTVACGLFAACCGSSLASAIAMGQMAFPEMKRYGYDAKLSVGTIAAGGTLGILIPPSIGFIVIGILTELSIGKLFIAGIIPGILEVLFYLGTIHIMCRVKPHLGPPRPKTTFGQKIGSLRLTWPVGLLFLLVIGGIYGGVFTPTEAGGIGAFGALTVSLIRRQLSGSHFVQCLLEAAKMAAMMLALIIGAFVFNQFLAVTRIPFVFSEYIIGLGLGRYAILSLVIFVYILLGMVFDIFAILVLTIPIIYPTIIELGFNPIWYAVIMVRVIEIGLITPPFGINLFGLAGTVNAPISVMYRGVLPFLLADILHVTLLVAVPSLSTFLPEIMMGR
jgi:tripartite ATP-independent transporter DctM subunit